MAPGSAVENTGQRENVRRRIHAEHDMRAPNSGGRQHNRDPWIRSVHSTHRTAGSVHQHNDNQRNWWSRIFVIRVSGRETREEGLIVWVRSITNDTGRCAYIPLIFFAVILYGIAGACSVGMYWSGSSNLMVGITSVFLTVLSVASTAIISVVVDLIPTDQRLIR